MNPFVNEFQNLILTGVGGIAILILGVALIGSLPGGKLKKQRK